MRQYRLGSCVPVTTLCLRKLIACKLDGFGILRQLLVQQRYLVKVNLHEACRLKNVPTDVPVQSTLTVSSRDDKFEDQPREPFDRYSSAVPKYSKTDLGHISSGISHENRSTGTAAPYQSTIVHTSDTSDSSCSRSF